MATAAPKKDTKPRVKARPLPLPSSHPTQAPVSIPGKAGKRAGEFFEVAFEREGEAGVTRLEKELAVLSWAVGRESKWDIETTTPFFPLEWKRTQVTKRIQGLGLSPLLVDLVMRLVEAGEVRRLGQVRVDYEETMRAFRREVDVTLITGHPLSADQLALMQRSIQTDYLAPADNLIFTASVDPSVRGGYKVVIKGQEHDLTWNRAQDEARDHARARRLAALDVVQSRSPKAPSLGLTQAVADLQADKEAPFAAGLFSRVLAAQEQVGKGSTEATAVREASKAL